MLCHKYINRSCDMPLKNVCNDHGNVKWLQFTTFSSWNVINISLENGHNFISYRVQTMYLKSICHTSYSDCHYLCVVLRHNVIYFFKWETCNDIHHVLRTAVIKDIKVAIKVVSPFTTNLSNIHSFIAKVNTCVFSVPTLQFRCWIL